MVSMNSHAKAQRPWHICLPVSAVKHKHPGKAAEEHPVRVGSHLHSYTGSQHHEHCQANTRRHLERVNYTRSPREGGAPSTGWETHQWKGSRSRGQTAPPVESCCWCAWLASRLWRPEIGRWTDRRHRAGTPRGEPGTTQTLKLIKSNS